MQWTERLNALNGILELGDGARAEILGWNYAPELADNVPHRHTFYEICLVGGWGAGEFRVAEKPYDLAPGTLFFARPGVIHQIVNTQSPHMELFWVSFGLEPSGGEIGQLVQAFSRSDVLTVRDERVISLWKTLAVVAQGQSVAWEVQMRSLSSALLLAIAQAGAGSAAPSLPPALETASAQRSMLGKAAVRYVHDNLSHKLSIAEVANYLHISPRHLMRIFSDFTGVSLAVYIERTRLDRAERLLLRTDKSIKEIANEVGYSDVAHFTRVFSKHNGNPPGDFRKRGGPLRERSGGANIQKIGDLV